MSSRSFTSPRWHTCEVPLREPGARPRNRTVSHRRALLLADTASTRDTGYYNDRFTYYDALGRLYTPIRHHQLPDGSVQWDPWAERCHYDPDGQAVVMCESGIAVSLDGADHSGTLGNAPWRFWGTGALDSPLMAMQKSANGSTALVLFVTDGAGRQFVAADSNGTQFSSPNDGGWTYTGGTGTTASFDSDRLSAGPTAGIAYFRNRTYDMNTGRWMQEDPIGIAGGDNLYQFNGNNPATFTDPFGLVGCKEHPQTCADALHEITADRDVARAATLIVAGRYVRAAVGLYRVGKALVDAAKTGEVSASTPVGRRGSEMHVPRGTNSSATINGRTYTGHALDRMQGRGLTPTVVEETIENGAVTAGRDGATVHTSSEAEVILNPNGSVKTATQK